MWWEAFGDRIRRDARLAELTTVRVGGSAQWLFEPEDDVEAGSILAAIGAEGIPHHILGGGSNLLPPDEPLPGVVIHPVRLTACSIEGTRLHSGAGTSLMSLVSRASQAGLEGAHVLAGIPGQVGGALAMNAGGRYGEIGSLVETIQVRLPGGASATLGPDELDFGYRHARLPEGALVTSVVLALRPSDDVPALRRETGRIIKEKNAAQPTRAWSFGCMFKNPPDTSAGVLVDRAGLKGHALGGARISPVHGNFVENLGSASAADIRGLIELAERRVEESFGVHLEREVRVWRA